MAKALAAAALLATPFIASHAALAQESRLHGNLMGGYSETLGSTSNYLQGGIVLDAGLSVTPSPGSPLEARFDLGYAYHYATIAYLTSAQQALGTHLDYGYGSILSGSANVLYHLSVARGVRLYAIGGIGAYYTRIELDQALPVYPFACFNFCYDYGYAEAQVAAHGVTNFGWDAGLGFEFETGYDRKWFIEARYQRVNSSSTIEYLPVTVGMRF